MFILLLIVLLSAAGGWIYLTHGVYEVPEDTAYIIERMGAYHKIAETGKHNKIPFLDNIAKQVPLSDEFMSIPNQTILSWDNYQNNIDLYVVYKVIEPQLYTYGAADTKQALEYLVICTMRNICGDIRKPEVVSKYDTVVKQLRETLVEATTKWGIEIITVKYVVNQ